MSDEIESVAAKIDAVLPRVPEFAGWRTSDGVVRKEVPDGGPCPICWKPLGDKQSARWTNLFYPESSKHMFYGMHPECSELGECEQRRIVDGAVLDWSEIQ